MTKTDVEKLGHGLFVLHWKKSEGGGTSLASVGSDPAGRRWFAATNWVSGPSFDWYAVRLAVRVPVPERLRSSEIKDKTV